MSHIDKSCIPLRPTESCPRKRSKHFRGAGQRKQSTITEGATRIANSVAARRDRDGFQSERIG
jgi:hypothetical protein